MGEVIRVLHVIGYMNQGGAENMIMNLYRKIDRNKIQFDFVENEGNKALFDDEITSLGGTIYHCPRFRGSNTVEYCSWWEDFWKKHNLEYRIVHGHIGSTAAIYLHIAKKYGVFTIAHSHSAGTSKSLHGLLYSLLAYPTRYIADYFFACSDAAGKRRFGEKTIHKSNYHVLQNAIDTSNFTVKDEIRKHVRDEFKISDDEYLIGHVGRYTSEKNHAFLLEVFKQVCEDRADVKLLMVGDGPLHKEMESLSVQLGIKDQVIFTGIRTDVNELMQGMDIFILPSLFEGLPVTMVEAQSSGLKCIMSDAVPTESILIEELVSVCSLKDSAEIWAKKIEGLLTHHHLNTTERIAACGYDIKTSAKWLEEFYESKNK